MNLKDEIANAIGAHGKWKARLSTAIDTGACEISPSVARTDNQCVFGKWLMAADAAVKSSSHYVKCRELHRKFHEAAASVLELAVTGKKEQASKAMAFGSDFSHASASLTKAMMEWSQSVH